MTGNIRVRDVCEKIHRDFVSQFKYARIWGPSAKFGGQSVGIDQKLVDTDIVELHMQ
jgi:ribosome-interacting GTPase 1